MPPAYTDLYTCLCTCPDSCLKWASFPNALKQPRTVGADQPRQHGAVHMRACMRTCMRVQAGVHVGGRAGGRAGERACIWSAVCAGGRVTVCVRACVQADALACSCG